jgi:tRNA-2-methylthio-N6-dimethylallyladenosine synthase
MYGCNNFCSYCIVPHTRDRERSRDSAAVVAEVRELVEAGYKEIMLLGQNVNSYRSDISFAELLRRCDAIPGDYVLRFMSSHPKDMPEELILAMAECTHVETHFHLPVQSGSNKVLKEMNRRYEREKYLSLVASLRESVPHIVLTSDVMVGFPGETEEDFEDTLDLLRRAEFDMVYSFLYSPRPGTPAAEREDQVPEDVKSERFSRLLRVQDAISLAKNQKEVGKTLRVLWCDRSKEEGVYSGRTKGGKLVHAAFPSSPIGTFRSVKIERAEPYALIGTPVDE